MWDRMGGYAPRLSATPPPRGNIGPPMQQFGQPIGPQPIPTQFRNAQIGQGPPPSANMLNNAPSAWQKPPMQGGMLGTPPPGGPSPGGMPGMGQVGPAPRPVPTQPMGQGQMPINQLPIPQMPQMQRPPGM